jgi:hypothetical protein
MFEQYLYPLFVDFLLARPSPLPSCCEPVKWKNASFLQPMKAQSCPYLKFEDVPLRVSEAAGETLADHSVALGRPVNANATKFEIYAGGALVRKGGRFGVLTAGHCLQKRGPKIVDGSPGGDALVLIVQRSHRVVIPPKALVARALGVPKERELEPDLAFLEILPGPHLRALKALAPFCSLDENPLAMEQEYGKAGRPLTVIGFPEGLHQAATAGREGRKIIKHLGFFYGIKKDGLSERDGWDYIEASDVFSGKNEPDAFKGDSSAPLWGLQITGGKNSRHYALANFALIGMAFLQVRITKSRVLVRAHFIKSIYDRAWKKLTS